MTLIWCIPRIRECEVEDISAIDDEIVMEGVATKSYLEGFEHPISMYMVDWSCWDIKT